MRFAAPTLLLLAPTAMADTVKMTGNRPMNLKFAQSGKLLGPCK